MVEINDVIDVLVEICEDSTNPKNLKDKMDHIINILKEKIDNSIKVNRALDELDEIVNDNNMQQFTRTQIWNVVSMLEKI